MASLYIHIPFCKKACHYCSFYFVLSQVKKEEFINSLLLEIEHKKEELTQQTINSVYFGGGTPSILSINELQLILSKIKENFTLNPHLELSIETNPENITESYLESLKQLGFNRISIGVQSFFDEDLQRMNRNHNEMHSIHAIELSIKYFENVSIDLIFGLPYSGMKHWKTNLEKAVSFGIKHISTYGLTVEEKTALAQKVAKKEINIESDATLNEMYLYTLDFLGANGYRNYEVSNFGKDNYWSKHNISYWLGDYYWGFGPSAHSYNGKERTWNISNLGQYISKIKQGKAYTEREVLTDENRYNEFILTRLRTIFGVDISEIKTTFGENYTYHFEKEIEKFISQKHIERKDNVYRLTNSGKILADYITSELMIAPQ